MENNKFQKLFGSINYNTYTNLENIFCVSAIGLGVVEELIPQYGLLNNSIEVLSYISFATYLGLSWSQGKNYTKDINEIRKLYQEFVKNYNKLNKIFDLNDPIQIHTMFIYLLYKGYLSKNKQFEFSDKESRNIGDLRGADVITGKGVCRHITSMLTDILKDYGIEAGNLGVYSKNYTINIKILDKQKYTKDELIDCVRTHIIDENTYSFIIKLIEKLIDEEKKNIELSYEITDDKNLLKRKIGNHSISVASKDGKIYFLDPTQSRIYRMREDNNGILYDDECDNIPIRTASSIVLNNLKDYFTIKQTISRIHQSVSKEEEREMITKTLKICNDNMDIFEQFHNQNNELYNDISSKILKIKKRKSIIKIT